MEQTIALTDRVITLKNGLKVANFSSPHSFTFVDGTVVPKLPAVTAKWLMLDVEEEIQKQRRPKFRTVRLTWKLSDNVLDSIELWYTLFILKKVDVVIVPLPVMTALHRAWEFKDVLKSPFRVIRVADRITKAIHTDKFCI